MYVDIPGRDTKRNSYCWSCSKRLQSHWFPQRYRLWTSCIHGISGAWFFLSTVKPRYSSASKRVQPCTCRVSMRQNVAALCSCSGLITLMWGTTPLRKRKCPVTRRTSPGRADEEHRGTTAADSGPQRCLDTEHPGPGCDGRRRQHAPPGLCRVDPPLLASHVFSWQRTRAGEGRNQQKTTGLWLFQTSDLLLIYWIGNDVRG